MHNLRIMVFATAALGLAQMGWSAGTSFSAEYVTGTVKSMGDKIEGKLDLADPSDLQFRFTVDKMRLPYANIRSFHFSVQAPHHKVAHVPVPKVPFHKPDQILDITFREEGGALGTASFRISAASRVAVEDLLKERVDGDKKTGPSAVRTKLPEAWWGDKNWKTNRNKAGWPDQQGDNAPVVAGTK